MVFVVDDDDNADYDDEDDDDVLMTSCRLSMLRQVLRSLH